MRRFRSLSIRKKLLAGNISIIFVMLVLLGISNYMISKKILTDESLDFSKKITNQLGQNMDSKITRLSEFTVKESFETDIYRALNPVYKERTYDSQKRMLTFGSNLMDYNKEIEIVLVRDNDGTEYRYASYPRKAEDSDISKMGEIYKQTEKTLKAGYFSGTEDLLFCSDTFGIVREETWSLMRNLDSFYQTLEQVSVRKTDSETDKLVEEIVKNAGGDEFKIKCFLSEVCITLYRHYRKILSDSASDFSVDGILDSMNRIVDISQGKTYLKNMTSAIKEAYMKEGEKKNPLAVQAMRYMKKHYRENISLTSMAEELSANPSYLSRLLKKETGSNFTDILTGVRIAAAKKFLDEGYRVAEAGEMAGYSDYVYFYQVFKRQEGISPSDYKKGKKN